MAARTDGKKQHQSPFISLLVSMFPQPLKFIQRWCSLACKDIDLTTAKQAAVDGPDQLLHKSANSLQMYLNALLKMLSGLGLRSIDVLTALQQLLKHPARMFGPTVSGHQVLACCVATFSQNHFHDATVLDTVALQQSITVAVMDTCAIMLAFSAVLSGSTPNMFSSPHESGK